jgi:hypothetical protein
MSPRSTKTFALVLFSVLAAGCPKPPEPPPPPPVVDAPPPPKCESLGEKCAAKADTRAKITNSEVEFSPAETWVYAQQSSATLAQTDDGGPAIAFLGVDVDAKDSKKDTGYKDAALAELVKQIGLSPLKRKVNWKKPDETKTIGAFKLGLWQLDEAGVRGARKGPLLVVAGPTSDTKGVVGVGFVPDDDKSQADGAIMKSIESIGKQK